MSVEEWMTIEPVVVTPQATVRAARDAMRSRGVRHLPVVEGGRLVGILSQRDVGLEANSEGWEDPVSQVMATSVHQVRPTATVGDAARVMLSRQVSAVPVTDEDGVLLGIITTTDCLGAALDVNPDLERHR